MTTQFVNFETLIFDQSHITTPPMVDNREDEPSKVNEVYTNVTTMDFEECLMLWNFIADSLTSYRKTLELPEIDPLIFKDEYSRIWFKPYTAFDKPNIRMLFDKGEYILMATVGFKPKKLRWSFFKKETFDDIPRITALNDAEIEKTKVIESLELDISYVSPVENVTTKDGREVTKQYLFVDDGSLDDEAKAIITFWDEEIPRNATKMSATNALIKRDNYGIKIKFPSNNSAWSIDQFRGEQTSLDELVQ